MNRSDDTGKLILRLALGIMILLHGIAKLRGGNGFISSTVVAHELPAVLAYGVYIGEVFAPLLLIVGFYTRVAAAVVAVNMLFAIWLVHAGQLISIGKQGGWALELQGMFLFSAVALALLGAGRFSLGGNGGKLN